MRLDSEWEQRRDEIAPTRHDAIAQGKTYYWGKPCRKHPSSPRTVSNYSCVMCRRAHALKHIKKYPERVAARKENWRLANKDYIASYNRARRELQAEARGELPPPFKNGRRTPLPYDKWLELTRQRIKERMNGS